MLHLSSLLFLLLIGLIAGFIDTLAGGGGMLTVPAYLMAGLPPHMTLGTNKFAATFGVANAVRIFIRKRILNPKYWFSAMIAGLVGAIIGAITVHFFSADFLRQLLPYIILALAVYVAVPKPKHRKLHKHVKPNPYSSAVLASFLGFYDGFFGPGTGSFWVVAVMNFYKIDLLEATGIAKLMNFISNLASLAVFMCYGSIDYWLALAMALAMIVGAHFGAHSAIRFGTKYIKPVFLIVVVAMAIRLLMN